MSKPLVQLDRVIIRFAGDSGDVQDTPIGVFRVVDRPTYDELARAQVEKAKVTRPADLGALLAGADTWQIS